METESNPLELALSFIDEQPHSAARILEQQPLDKTAEFINTIPLHYQTLLVHNLLPAYAAELMDQLDMDTVSSIAGAAEISVLSRILRLLDHDKSRQVLQRLKRLKRSACELLLRYPHHSVGAWMKPDLAIVSSDMTVRDARTYLRNTWKGNEADFIFVTDRQNRLEGWLPSLVLVRANKIQHVYELMTADPPWMSPNFLLEEAARSYLWENNDKVVVVDRDHHILGLLRHADLRVGLHQQQERETGEKDDSNELLATLLSTYGSSMLVLFNTVLDVVEADLKS